MNKFKVGDTVELTKAYDSNLPGTKGVVMKVLTADFIPWPYLVQLDGSTEDWLCSEDELKLVEGPLEVVTKPETTTTPKEKEMTDLNYTITDNSITIMVSGKIWTVMSSDGSFEKLKDLIKTKASTEEIEDLLDKPKQIAKLSAGLVTVLDYTVYYKDDPVHDVLSVKLLDMLDEGFDATPWAMFMNNLMENPSYRAREQLYQFLEKHGAPITSDGNFLAFKNVREDFKDIHSGTFDNSPGKTVSMPREKVDDDANRTCSSGLHACASPYLDSFYASGGKTVVVKINPRDVVSIPVDYNFAKMRVSQYEVMSEISKDNIKTLGEKSYTDEYDPQPQPFEDYDNLWDYLDDDDYYDSYNDYYNSYDED